MCDFSRYGAPSEEWLAIEKTLPPMDPNADVTKLKIPVNRDREISAAQVMKKLADRVETQDFSIPTRDGDAVSARSYRPVRMNTPTLSPIYIHLHGGGYLFGTLSSEDGICANLALEANVVVFNVNYRHTPEHPYPTAWQDVQDAFAWLHAHITQLCGDPKRVIVGGVSAGAKLTAALVLGQNLGNFGADLPQIAGQVLMIPALVHEDCHAPQLAQLSSSSVSSIKENENAPILPAHRAHRFTELLAVKDPRNDDLQLNPGNALPEQVYGLPPSVFGIAGLDMLRDEGLLYAKKLTEAGVTTDIYLFKGVPHGFRRFGDKLSASSRWDSVMTGGISWILSNPKPSGRFDIKS